MKLITVKASITTPLSQVWEKWTSAHHVTKWNFASPDWHCPSAENKVVEGGEFHHLMAAKDGSFQFQKVCFLRKVRRSNHYRRAI